MVLVVKKGALFREVSSVQGVLYRVVLYRMGVYGRAHGNYRSFLVVRMWSFEGTTVM